jgi:hypothetical protein
MIPFERLAIAYFLILLIAAPRAPRWRRGVLYACAAIALVIVARFALPWPGRAWIALAYLVLGYWIPAVFTGPRNERFERWLVAADARLGLGVQLAPTRHVAGTLTALLELAYLMCYPMVPATFAIVFAYGSERDVVAYWTSVLAAGFVCYVTLPWTSARPPRLLEHAAEPSKPRVLREVNRVVLGRMSHQRVTFPSGHVAVAIAAAFAVWPVWPGAALVFGFVALVIAAAAVAGEYHFLIDVLLGVVVGVVVPALALLGS